MLRVSSSVDVVTTMTVPSSVLRRFRSARSAGESGERTSRARPSRKRSAAAEGALCCLAIASTAALCVPAHSRRRRAAARASRAWRLASSPPPPHLTATMAAALRSTRVLRQKLTSDPFAYHATDETPLWRKIRRAIVVNPCVLARFLLHLLERRLSCCRAVEVVDKLWGGSQGPAGAGRGGERVGPRRDESGAGQLARAATRGPSAHSC